MLKIHEEAFVIQFSFNFNKHLIGVSGVGLDMGRRARVICGRLPIGSVWQSSCDSFSLRIERDVKWRNRTVQMPMNGLSLESVPS